MIKSIDKNDTNILKIENLSSIIDYKKIYDNLNKDYLTAGRIEYYNSTNT